MFSIGTFAGADCGTCGRGYPETDQSERSRAQTVDSDRALLVQLGIGTIAGAERVHALGVGLGEEHGTAGPTTRSIRYPLFCLGRLTVSPRSSVSQR